MKTEKFGPYEFVIVESHMRLNRRRTLKEYTDMMLNLAIIVGSSIALYVGFTFALPNKDEISEKLIIWFLIVVFIILIYISFKRLFQIVFLPLRDIIHLDKKKKVVNHRMPGTEANQVPLDRVIRLEYGYQEDSIHPIFRHSYNAIGWPTPSSAIVYARTKEKKRFPILLIREPNVQYPNNPGIDELAKPLAERLGELLNIPAKFHRHISIDHYTGKES